MRAAEDSSAAVLWHSVSKRKYSHLCRRSDRNIFCSYWQKTHRITKALRDAFSPHLKLRARPLEAVILVPQFARWQILELDVVLHVGCRQYHHIRFGELKQHALE